jgi:hypothetical protein
VIKTIRILCLSLLLISYISCNVDINEDSNETEVYANVTDVIPDLNGPSIIQNSQQVTYRLSASGISGDDGGRIYGMVNMNGEIYYSDPNHTFTVSGGTGHVDIQFNTPGENALPIGYCEIWGNLYADTPYTTHQSESSDTFPIYNQRVLQDILDDDALRGTVNGIGTYLLQGYTYDNCYGTTGLKRDFGPNPGELTAMTSYDLIDKNNTFYSYRRSLAYDIAAGAIAFTMLNEQKTARELLALLKYILESDGSIGFSLNTYGDNFYDMNNKKSGTIAWCGYAMAFYQKYFNDPQFQETAQKIAAYLMALQVQNSSDDRYGLIRGSDTASWVNVEHNVDAYFFFDLMFEIILDNAYFNVSDLIKGGLLQRLWDDKEGRFYVAVQGNQSLNKEKVLDANSWGAIFLIAVSETQKARRALDYVEQHFLNSHDGVQAYKPYSGQIRNTATPNDWDNIQMVWSEGSFGVALAYLKLGEVQKAQQVIDQIMKMQKGTGLFKYATLAVDDFVQHGSAAGSNWFILVRMSQKDAKWLNGFWSR